MECYHDGNIKCEADCELVENCPDRYRMLEVRSDAIQEVLDYLQQSMNQAENNEQALVYGTLKAVKTRVEQIRKQEETTAAGDGQKEPKAESNGRSKTMAAGGPDPEKPETVTAVIEKVCEDICKNYCRYTNEAWDDNDNLSERCDNCPLNRLN